MTVFKQTLKQQTLKSIDLAQSKVLLEIDGFSHLSSNNSEKAEIQLPEVPGASW